ncbi:MAG: G5 domain-containing protein [Chloroflexi bacterium]|nr:G5 domain-containing protein [Chloroflexota bacterium]
MKKGFLVAGFLILIGALLIWVGSRRPIQIISSEGTRVVSTRTWNVSRVLAQAGFSLGERDTVVPGLDKLTGWQNPVFINRASQVRIVDVVRGLDISIPSRERIPANLLLEAGLRLYPGDLVLLDGQSIPIHEPLPYQPVYSLQVIPAQKLVVSVDDRLLETYSTLPSLGQALWAAGYPLRAADRVSENLKKPLSFLKTIIIQPAQTIKIITADQRITSLVVGSTTGQALNDAGVSLQGLDYSIPAENDPLPANGKIQVVRVQEDIALSQVIIPYESESIQDSQTELGQVRIIEQGEYGLKVSRERIRFENGLEVSRQIEAEWVAAEPKTELLGIGTKITLKTIDTPSGTLEYWRAITAVATSYSPCNLGNDTCNNTTASGMELRRGVIAVSCSLYSSLRGMQVYIPGYGKAVIADCGGGIAGAFWVDLGFSDADYETWHGAVTVYFLPPVPAYIPYELQ